MVNSKVQIVSSGLINKIKVIALGHCNVKMMNVSFLKTTYCLTLNGGITLYKAKNTVNVMIIVLSPSFKC